MKPMVQGVGGVVLDEEGRALVVRLRYGYQQHLWRFPGGYARGTEHVFEAAEREVLEETGVRVRAVSLISLTSTVQGVCLEFLMTLEGETVSGPRPQRGEIAEASWTPLERLAQADNVEFHTRRIARELLRIRHSGLVEYPGLIRDQDRDGARFVLLRAGSGDEAERTLEEGRQQR